MIGRYIWAKLEMECHVRLFTAMRKGIKQYASNEGAERTAVYMSVE